MNKIKGFFIILLGIFAIAILPCFFIVGFLNSHDFWGVLMGIVCLVILIGIISGFVKSLKE